MKSFYCLKYMFLYLHSGLRVKTMKIFCLSLFLNCFITTIYSQPYFQWVHKTEALSIVIKHDASGNVITAGTFSNTTDFDPGPGVFTLSPNGISDDFITKIDA
jgi:hypothetical protein